MDGLTHHGSDDTRQSGWRSRGGPVITMARGRVVFDDGKTTAEPGRGAVLPRGISGRP